MGVVENREKSSIFVIEYLKFRLVSIYANFR